ncbi:MAG: glycosyltransferase family 2 protein [Waterburya sp.]
MKPEVSVIVPAYNSEDYLPKALESVFNQTYNNLKVILIDDASSDSTVKIATSFSDKRLKIIKNQQNKGVSYSRNCGIQQAQGNWIALLDSDDWYAPERLEKLLSIAQQRRADLIADDLWLVSIDQSQPWSTLLTENEQAISSVELIDAVEFAHSDRPSPLNSKRNWSLGYTKPLIKQEFLQKNNIQYDETVKVGEDFILYLECLRQQARFYIVPQAYYYYQTRTVSLSTRKPTDYLSHSCKITQVFINQELKVQTNPKLIEVLAHNLIVFKKRLAYYRLVEHIKNKRLLKIYQQIIIHPYVLRYLANKLTKKIKSVIKEKIILNNIN